MGTRLHHEHGIALIAVLLLMFLVSALGAALAVSGQIEGLMVRNHRFAAQARAAAEAGLSHALQLTVSNLNAWRANGHASASTAITALLRGPDNAANEANANDASNADNGSLEALEGAGETELVRPPARVAIPGMPGAWYEARFIDEDNPIRNLSAADRARIGENGQTATDGNTVAVVRVIGYGPENTVVTLEATLARTVLPAIVSNDSLVINGNPSIEGSHGSVHTNQHLTVTGSPFIAENATASGEYAYTGSPDIGGIAGGGRPNLPIPPIRASDYKAGADFILGKDGIVTDLTDKANPKQCNASSSKSACEATYGWVFTSPGWKITANSAVDGTFYVEGDATISGNPGSVKIPVKLSIFAEGNIEITGNPNLIPDSPELLFVTDLDLRIAGTLTMPITIEGQILVHEQMFISGNPKLSGQILVENASTLSTLVEDTQISGNPTITYNGIAGASGFSVNGWRQVR